MEKITTTPKPKREGRARSLSTDHMPSHKLTERWFLVDATGATAGRLATKIAHLLMGKDLASYNHAVDAKTNVIVINSGQIKFTGDKMGDKMYYKHRGYFGSLKSTTPEKILEGKHPERVLESAIYGMLPKNKLRHVMMKRLKLYPTSEHPHTAQTPVTITF